MFTFAISMGIGMIPTMSPKFFNAFPDYLTPLMQSGVLLTVIVAVVLNLLFNGIPRREERAAGGMLLDVAKGEV